MKHTREFKESAIQLVLNSNEEIKTYNRTSSKSKVKESIEEELRRLRRDNRILKQERDILKKAAAYFAKETL